MYKLQILFVCTVKRKKEEKNWHDCKWAKKWMWGLFSVHNGLSACCSPTGLCSGELQMQKLKSHLVRTQSLRILPLKPEVGQYIAIHATLTARDFSLLISTLPVHSSAFFPNISRFFLALAVANTGSCVGPQNKIGHPAGCRFPCWVPTDYK